MNTKSTQQLAKEEALENSIVASSSQLINLNTRISKKANEKLNLIWAIKQAEYNIVKFPKQSVVESIINIAFDEIMADLDNKPKLKRVVKDANYYLGMEGNQNHVRNY